MTRPTLREGDVGIDVKDLLNLLPTYYFDSSLANAVEDYQRSRGLDVDGVVGPATWAALESNAPPYEPPGMPPPLPPQMVEEIKRMAGADEDVVYYNWDDRGQAPIGYIYGVALSFAAAYKWLLYGYPPAIEMGKARTNNSKDVFNVYAEVFDVMKMDNSQDGPDSLRHLWALLWGLGMRESSGQHCCGRDTSAENTSSDTCEAGAWQTSYNAHNSCEPEWGELFKAFNLSSGKGNPQGFVTEFSEDVSCKTSDWDCYGSGNGYIHQEMSKSSPAYAAHVCALTLRNLCNHYGPINRGEVELRADVDRLLQRVMNIVDAYEPIGQEAAK